MHVDIQQSKATQFQHTIHAIFDNEKALLPSHTNHPNQVNYSLGHVMFDNKTALLSLHTNHPHTHTHTHKPGDRGRNQKNKSRIAEIPSMSRNTTHEVCVRAPLEHRAASAPPSLRPAAKGISFHAIS